MGHGRSILAMGRCARTITLLLAACLLPNIAVTGAAQELFPKRWWGERVFPIRRDCKLLQQTDDIRGDLMLVDQFVEDVRGSALLVSNPPGQVWVTAEEVVPIDRAVQYDLAIADEIEAIRLDPRGRIAYVWLAEALANKKDVNH